jgi:hypothetical protein
MGINKQIQENIKLDCFLPRLIPNKNTIANPTNKKCRMFREGVYTQFACSQVYYCDAKSNHGCCVALSQTP